MLETAAKTFTKFQVVSNFKKRIKTYKKTFKNRGAMPRAEN